MSKKNRIRIWPSGQIVLSINGNPFNFAQRGTGPGTYYESVLGKVMVDLLDDQFVPKRSEFPGLKNGVLKLDLLYLRTTSGIVVGVLSKVEEVNDFKVLVTSFTYDPQSNQGFLHVVKTNSDGSELYEPRCLSNRRFIHIF